MKFRFILFPGCYGLGMYVFYCVCIIFVVTSLYMDTTVVTEIETSDDKVIKDDSRR